MTLDEKIYKQILKELPDFQNYKDLQTMNAIDYLLQVNRASSLSRDYSYKLNNLGLMSMEYSSCLVAGKGATLNLDIGDRAKLVISSIEEVIQKMSADNRKNLLIGTAIVHYIDNILMRGNDSIKEKMARMDREIPQFRGYYRISSQILNEIESTIKEKEKELNLD